MAHGSTDAPTPALPRAGAQGREQWPENAHLARISKHLPSSALDNSLSFSYRMFSHQEPL